MKNVVVDVKVVVVVDVEVVVVIVVDVEVVNVVVVAVDMFLRLIFMLWILKSLFA